MLASLWTRAPLLGFALVGGAAFLALSPCLSAGKARIVVDARTLDGIYARRVNREGRLLSEVDKREAVDDYVSEEILVREAYRNGWHLVNGRVRERLLVSMRSALAEAPSQPSNAQLRAYFQANTERYRLPAAVSFEHVFFARASERTPPDPVRFLESLRRAPNPAELGEPHFRGFAIERESEFQLTGGFGARFAAELFALEPGSWAGPLDSDSGTHYVRVSERVAPALPEFEAVQRIVRIDWMTSRLAEMQERQMEQIRRRYDIRRKSGS